VALEDLVGAILHSLKSDVHGAVNVVSPNPVTNLQFTRILAKALSRPAAFPMPAFAVRIVFGQMGDELLLASARVAPSKLQASQYQFRFVELKRCLDSILKTKN
jgi:NAD dependent epimerase/dehydratase family enzyme